MVRKFLFVVAGAVVLVILAALALRLFPERLSQLAFEPSTAFQPAAPLAAADYAAPDKWLVRPGVDGERSYLAVGNPPAAPQAQAPAVFFVPPTSFLDRRHWNAPPAVDAATLKRDRIALHLVASAFADGAELWVPRYRQATFGAFFSDKPEAGRALDLAYGDVLAAFDQFIAAIPPDRPVVLAGHSQGALHLKRLLKDRVAGQPVKARIAAVYAIGWGVSPAHDLPAMGLPACTGADQPGCVMSWLSFAEPADTTMARHAFARRPALDGSGAGQLPVLCTNPLTGGAAAEAPAGADLGTLVAGGDGQGGGLTARLVPARCSPDGLLLIGPAPALGPLVLPGNNYHVYDVALFWGNVRADMARRVAAWRNRF
ncbi:MAG: DUF3089 domain-containing protein [Proteobacteria bacterium]|nr:DUF3089 domain-containing protein [Pseudomonadota bacterium]